jgi:hypothetical protein
VIRLKVSLGTLGYALFIIAAALQGIAFAESNGHVVIAVLVAISLIPELLSILFMQTDLLHLMHSVNKVNREILATNDTMLAKLKKLQKSYRQWQNNEISLAEFAVVCEEALK